MLNAAVSARKPVLASSGEGFLKSGLEKYERENSWEENEKRVVQSMKEVPAVSDGESREN